MKTLHIYRNGDTDIYFVTATKTYIDLRGEAEVATDLDTAIRIALEWLLGKQSNLTKEEGK